jgi:hypothetical protein
MSMHVVQLRSESGRRVGIVEGAQIRVLNAREQSNVYDFAQQAIAETRELQSILLEADTAETLDYEAIYEAGEKWRLLPCFDHPYDSAHCMVSGTGLTHKASAENRAAMHKSMTQQLTDSMRMYQMGLEGGKPAPGQIGVQPEWFYKGDGSILRGHGDDLNVPAYAWDGGEEPEIAGVYLIGLGGEPFRVGLTMANEFSDHQMEKKNYLYLAPSKLRNCSIGPELVIGDVAFEDVPGEVSITRNGSAVWKKEIWTGEKNMSYSVANLEHHHFKYEAHRRPGDVHIHFFGADAFSFGENVALEAGDVMEVGFSGFGRRLRNQLQIAPKPEAPVSVKAL